MDTEKKSAPSKVVFLDRDGVINRCAAPHDYVKSWQEFQFLPGVAEAIRALRGAGYRILVVTNQRGVSRGMMSMADVDEIHRHMCAELSAQGADIDGIYVCPHDIGQCTCRKPGIGLFQQAEAAFFIDKDESWMVGDSADDETAGRRYGVKTLRTSSLPLAAEQILQKSGENAE